MSGLIMKDHGSSSKIKTCESTASPVHVLVLDNAGASAGALNQAITVALRSNFDVRIANTLDALARILQERQTDVILLECGAGARNRIEFMSALSIVAGSVPVVVLAPEDQTGLFGIKHGADDYLATGQYDGCMLARVIRSAHERALYRGSNSGNYALTDRQLVTAISHELKNPLTAMTFDLANLLDGAAGSLPDGLRVYIRKFADSCERMAFAINGLIDRIQKERQ